MLINSNDRKSYEGGGHIMQIIEVNNENMGGILFDYWNEIRESIPYFYNTTYQSFKNP